MNRSTAFLKSFLPFVLFMLINAIVSVVVAMFFSMKATMSGELDGGFVAYLDGLTTDTTYIQVTSLVFAIIILVFFTIWYRRVFVRPLKNKTKKYWSGISFQVIISIIFLAVGLQYVAKLAILGIEKFLPTLIEQYNQLLLDAGYDDMSLLLMIYVLVLAPIAEEIVFRGLTMRFSRKWLPFWGANIFQAILFGVMHLNVVQGLYAFVIGLFFGWVCQKGHSIKYSIILHILFNLLGTYFLEYVDLTLSMQAYLFYAIGVGLTVFALLVFRWEFSEKNRKYKSRRE